MSNFEHDNRQLGGSGLAMAAAQLASGRNSPDLKSSVFVKLETMIQTLQMFRHEMDGQRVPKFEEHFNKKQDAIEEKRIRDKRRRERRQQMQGTLL